MKLLFITSILFLAMNSSRCQTQYYNQSNEQGMQEISTTQTAGYLLMGLGASAIIYTAAKTNTVKNPTAWYIGGSAFIAGGICLLIFGDKDPEPKYWRGMQGYVPDKNLRNDFLITVLKIPPTSPFKAIDNPNLKLISKN